MPVEWINRGKEILIAVAGLLVVVLQIINMLLSIDLEHLVSGKADTFERKANTLEQKANTLEEIQAGMARSITGQNAELAKHTEELHRHVQATQEYLDKQSNR